MPFATRLTPPIQSLPDSPAPKNAFAFTDAQDEQTFSPPRSCRLGPQLSPPHCAPPSIQFQPSTDEDHDEDLIVSHSTQDEYTLTAYGDISLSDVIVPPSPDSSTHPSSDAAQQRIPQPRLRLKVQRPPMPKRRMNYSYIADPLPPSEGMEFDERWPGSPRPIKNSQAWLQHQPLVSPLSVEFPGLQTRGSKPSGNGSASLEKLVELLPRSLSPPGSPTSQAISLPQQTHGRETGSAKQSPLLANDVPAKLPQSPHALAPRKEKPWRTRLPPRPPIPKWDV